MARYSIRPYKDKYGDRWRIYKNGRATDAILGSKSAAESKVEDLRKARKDLAENTRTLRKMKRSGSKNWFL
jgi:hypothetical protein